jgi:hypothetical protein
MSGESSPLDFGDVVIIGGGCYGTFYAGQLERARDRGRVTWRQLLVVDRDPACQLMRELGESPDRRLVTQEWNAFLDDYLSGAQGETQRLPARPPARLSAQGPSQIVPSPLMPHLMYEWLLRRARARWPGREVETRPLHAGPGTPYDVEAPDGTRYLSFADWLCPTHCIEPSLCPVTRAPRTWEMSDALQRWVERRDRETPTCGPVLFTCRHQAFGVGTFGVAEVLAGDVLVGRAGEGGAAVDVLVGTVSACHGAASLLHLGAATA